MLKIGDFSKLSRVSVRMLRHNDDIGLLRPRGSKATAISTQAPCSISIISTPMRRRIPTRLSRRGAIPSSDCQAIAGQ